MPDEPRIVFLGEVANGLTAEQRDQIAGELLRVVRKLRPDNQPSAITVSRRYSGYTVNPAVRLVLGVEVRHDDGYETHIIKIGTPYEVGSDAEGWQRCTAGRLIGSRILSPVRSFELDRNRVAVVYRDAYTLFGPDSSSDARPESLETVATWAVREERVDPVSVERAIAHIFTDLGLWFYADAQPHPNAHQPGEANLALEFFRARLEDRDEKGKLLRSALDMWDGDRDREGLRRDALWLLCGRDKPEDDARGKRPRYLDPVELVRWALETGTLPETLVGRSHGDLHGRNVLLGVRRGEADYPAVFDYGSMRPDNVLVWDFVKLETELKVRLLEELYLDRDPAARNYLLGRWPDRIGTESDPAQADRTDDPGSRANRLLFAFGLEELLARETESIQSKKKAERLQPPGAREITKVAKLDRLLGLLLRIRQEAALWLGYHNRSRYAAWREEYYFALAVYGLINIRWKYEIHWMENALIAAGVAAAGLRFATTAIQKQIGSGHLKHTSFPSYRVPLALAHQLWSEGRSKEGRAFLETVLPRYPHAIALQAEHALLSLDDGAYYKDVERRLDGHRASCKLFRDHETLARLGKAFKANGDRLWPSSVPFEKLRFTPAHQMYQQAFKVYLEAYELEKNYYPGVNAATLALLIGDEPTAQRIAEEIAEALAQPLERPADERAWVYASEGEAAVVLKRTKDAVHFYTAFLAELATTESQYADVAYQQLVRLWRVLGEGVVGPVLDVFEKGRFSDVIRTCGLRT